MSDDEKRRWREETKAKSAALPPEERERRVRNLVEAITPDLMIEAADEDGVSLAVDDASHDGGRFALVDIGDVDTSRSIALDEAGVRALVAWGQAWLDAPRLAARSTAEAVAADTANDLELVKTSAGEWGVLSIESAFDDDGNATGNERRALAWFAGEDAARARFDEECDAVTCEDCDTRLHRDDANSIEDGYLCTECYDAAVERFKVTRYRCADGACGWSGLGPEAKRIDPETIVCPTCDEFVEEAGDTAPEAGEATP